MNQFTFLGDSIEKAVIKIEIPSTYKNEALRDLLQMNLHRASLFPDLDGYAYSMRIRYNSYRTPTELIHEANQKQKDKNYPFIP